MSKVDNYLETIFFQEELEMLSEFDFKNMISKITPEEKTKKMLKTIDASMDKNKPLTSFKKIKKIVSGLPKVDINNAEKYFNSKITNFKQLNNISKRVIQNSLNGISDSMIPFASFVVTLSSFVSKDGKTDPKANLKSDLKDFILKVRKFSDTYESSPGEGSKISKEDIPDLAVAWVIVTMATSVGIAVIMGSGVVFAAIGSATGTIMILAGCAVIITGMIWAIEKLGLPTPF